MRRALRWLFEDRTTRDGHLVVWQWPNIPLWTWIVAAVLGHFLSGGVGTVVHVIGAVGLAVWAVMEIGWGVNPFRRMLGGVVLAATVVGLLMS
ncbi:MAG TPA: hypothetical protein VHD87_01485 [Acidimicrobiales bacterium]|nr:hypothetical protein [Acidimicrobiales bacterium]